jgi:hypothetical protein
MKKYKFLFGFESQLSVLLSESEKTFWTSSVKLFTLYFLNN